MTTPLTKLIAENKERPIAEAPECEIVMVTVKGGSRAFCSKRLGVWNSYGGINATHFRPLPDDRLAFVAEHYRAGVDAFISMFEPLAEKSGIYGAALEFAQGLQKQATAIAEGEE